ncbi:hypothetical protein EUTSA_v10009588mg [Eutrema salsugineum]|uniref:Uncharacterized protein n=1 Tax=Eutrema salsugineum TaxID=72664 RepID=V4K7X4_EUTSA|nr:hypothetical protein EUTSA_v10009588mg [Eutrema salsugineum]
MKRGREKIQCQKTKRGREIPDSVTTDLTIEIFSRLPAKSAARFRSLSKLWGSMLHRHYFTELFLTRSCARPRLLFALKRDGEREWSFFSSPLFHNPYEKSSLSADFHVKLSRDMFPTEFRGPASGLIYFSGMRISQKKGEDALVPVIFNPRTRQYATLPKLTRYNQFYSFLGFDPIGKQFKVLSMGHLGCSDDHMILTLGTGEMNWRKIQYPFKHDPYSQGICINGVLYYLASTSTSRVSDVIVCFDVRSEKFKFIKPKCFYTILVNYKGKLGGIKLNGDGHSNTLELCLWVLEDVEKQEWSNYVYTLPGNKSIDLSYASVVGVTAKGEIVLTEKYTFRSKPFFVFYFNPERKTFQRVEIQGFGEYYHENLHIVSAFVDYVEVLTMQSTSSQAIAYVSSGERPKLPKPQKLARRTSSRQPSC